MTIDGKRIRVPTELKNFPIKPNSDTGQQVIVYADSFVPETLYANIGTIVFTNLTPSTEELTFPQYPNPATPLHSGPIRPGETFRLKVTHLVAIVYHGANGASGYLNVGAIPGA